MYEHQVASSTAQVRFPAETGLILDEIVTVDVGQLWGCEEKEDLGAEL